jgi:hypothetical protein
MRKCVERGGTEETNSRQSHSLRWHAIMVDGLMHWGERCVCVCVCVGGRAV